MDEHILFINAEQHKQRPSATKKRYILEGYPSARREISDYNSYYHTFRPITPPRIYEQHLDRPYVHHLDNQQQISHYHRHNDSPPASELEFVMETLGGNTKQNTDLKSGNQRKKSHRQHLLHNVFDFIAIAVTCLIFGLIYLLIKPFQRGFYCDDTSIQYPYKSDTIPMWLLGLYGGLGPVVIFFIVEIWVVRPFNCGRGAPSTSIKQRRIDYLKTIVQTILLFGLGVAVCFLITEVGKRTIGRLRPYYLTVCNPIWSDIECKKTVLTRTGPVDISLYVTNHRCDTTFSAKELQEARLSFPSGHSSYSTYAFVFLFVYFEARLVCPNIQFLKPFLQCLCIAIAFFTCLSRVTDYKHHASDVIGGAIIGLSVAIFTAVRVGTYLWSFSIYCETEEETKKDRLPREERVPIPGLDTRPSGSLRTNEDIHLEPISYRHGSSNTRPPPPPHQTNRAISNNGISTSQPKSFAQAFSNGGRRVAPEQTFDEVNG